jgi:hypothetical protein
MLKLILGTDVLAAVLLVFALGASRTWRGIRYALVGGLGFGVLAYASYLALASHKPHFHMPPDWFLSLFFIGPWFVIGFVLGAITGVVDDSLASSKMPSTPQIPQLCRFTRLTWMIGLSIFAVGAAMKIPDMFVRESMKVRPAAFYGPILSAVGAVTALLSSGLAICGCFRVGPQFRRVAMVELAFGLPVLAVIIILQFAF